MTKLGFLKRGDIFIFEGSKYKILGLGNRSYNNVKCMDVITHKYIWLDVDTEVEEVLE